MSVAEIHKPRKFLPQRPAGARGFLIIVIWPHRAHYERIARIQIFVAIGEKAAEVILVHARTGQNLNAAETGPVEFSREWIGVDADLADGTLWRHLTAAETIDKHLRSVRTSGRTGDSGKFRR